MKAGSFPLLALIIAFGVQAARGQATTVSETPVGSTGDYDQVKAITFSEDSRHVAFLGMKGDKQFIVSDGKVIGTYDWVIPDSLILSPMGKHVAYVIQDGNDMSVVI